MASTQEILTYLQKEYEKLEADFQLLSTGPADQRARTLGKMAAIKGLQEYIQGAQGAPPVVSTPTPAPAADEPDLPDTNPTPTEMAALRANLEEQASITEDLSDEAPEAPKGAS